MTSLHPTSTAKKSAMIQFRPTRYITIFLRSIQRIQIYKISKHEICTLKPYLIILRETVFTRRKELWLNVQIAIFFLYEFG